MKKLDLPPEFWRGFGSSIQTANECGMFGGLDHISVFDPKRADDRRVIVERNRIRWVFMPITYTDTNLRRFATRIAHSAKEIV